MPAPMKIRLRVCFWPRTTFAFSFALYVGASLGFLVNQEKQVKRKRITQAQTKTLCATHGGEMEYHDLDDIATGGGGIRFGIQGRPRPGKEESYVIVEEPGEPVLTHFIPPRGHVPHFKAACENCRGDKPVPLWYVGAVTVEGDLVILELTWKCFRTAAAASKTVGLVHTIDESGEATGSPRFSGLLVKIKRASAALSPRVLRCEQRVDKFPAWPYRTREELARIWGVPTKPRIYLEDQA
jgi:hypothetical protein